MRFFATFSPAGRWSIRQGLALVAIVFGFGIGLFLWIRERVSPVSHELTTEQVILQRLGERMILPEGVPVFTHVEDVDLLRSVQPALFRAVQAGDWMVRYPQFIIIYRPSEERVIQAATIAQP